MGVFNKGVRIMRGDVKWKPPQKNWIKLNFDGASKGNPGRAGGGMFHNAEGHIMAIYEETYGWKLACYA
jgi:hypothetical protein